MAAIDPIVAELAAERRRQGLSQRAVGRMLGTSSATVNAWERGLASPVLSNLREWAGVLGHTLTLEWED